MTRHETFAVHHQAKLTVGDFLALSERGAFDDYARSELIEGEIWVVNAVHRRHARAHANLTGELLFAVRALGSSIETFSNPSTQLSDISLPEPDIVLAEPASDTMIAGASVRLAVEISDSTLDFDLGRKARLYARHGVPEYWVADVEARVIHQFWAPSADGYGERLTIGFGVSVRCATIEALTVATASL